MLLYEGAPDAGQMHDREDPGSPEIIPTSRDGVGVKPSDLRIVLARQGWRTRRDKAVDLALLEQRGNRGALRRIFHPHARRELDPDLLRPARSFDPSSYPDDVRRLYPVLILQDDPRPHACGELKLGQADASAFEVFRRLDPVPAHIDRVMAEGARDEGGHADIWAAAFCCLDREARHRKFPDIKTMPAKCAKKIPPRG